MAGLIDGDGDVRIKRQKYPQCVIRITSGFSQDFLAKCIKKNLNCSISISFRKKESEYKGKIMKGSWYALEFYMSSKNEKFIKQFILPYINLPYKADKIRNYIMIKNTDS